MAEIEMRKYSNYMILPESRLILECCKGQASVEDAVSMKKTELADELYSPDYNIVVDFREFETTLDATTKESTENFFDFLKELNINSKIAILTTAPHQVVISIMLKELGAVQRSLRIEVFSTLEAAARYLGIPGGKLDFIKNKILELSRNTSCG